MHAKIVKVINSTGLHARPASDFVAKAKEYKCSIQICRNDEGRENAVNAKSVVLLLTLGVEQGEEVEIYAEGEDEEEAVESLVALIESGLGEEE